MKKIITISLCILFFSMIFAGCKPGGNVNNSGNAVDTAATNAEVKPVNLSFVHWRSEDVETFKKLIAQFEKDNSGVTIDMEVTSTNLDEYYTLVRTRMAGGQDMDVLCVHPGTRLQEIAAASKLMDLTDLPVVNHYMETLQEAGKGHDGKIYGLPMAYNSHVIYYNKKIFKDNGVEAPKTWNELVDVCSKFKSLNIDPIAAGFAESWVVGILAYPILASYNYDNPKLQLDLEQGKVLITGDKYRATFEAVKEASEKGFFQKDAGGTKYEPATTLFAQGKTAMLINGTWGIGAVKNQNPDIELGFFPIPTPNNSPVMQILPAQALAIYADTRNKDVAVKFIEHLSTTESASLYGKETIQIVGVNGVSFDIPELNDITGLINDNKTVPFMGLFFTKNKLATEFYTTCAKVFLGVDIDTATKEAQAIIDAEKDN